MIVSPVSTVGALHVTLNTPCCGSGVTVTLLGARGAATIKISLNNNQSSCYIKYKFYHI